MNTISASENWIKVLGKGMVTLPADWRIKLGIGPGAMLKAKFTGDSIVLKPVAKAAPYRIFSDEEIAEFLENDKL